MDHAYQLPVYWESVSILCLIDTLLLFIHINIFQNEEIRLRSMPDTNGNNVNIVARDFDGIPSDITLSIAASEY